MRPLTFALLNRWLALAALTCLPIVPVAAQNGPDDWVGTKDDFLQACKVDNPGRIDYLFKQGIDPNVVEPERNDSCLLLAVREDSMRALRAILKIPGVNLEHTARNGDSAIMLAAFKGNMEAVKTLLDKGAKVNRSGWTALHYGAASGNTAILKLLLAHQAQVDAPAPNGTTALMMAARGGHIYSVKLLLDAGADPLLKNQQGYDAIEMAKLFNNTDIVEGLQYQIKKRAAAKAAASGSGAQ
ncbi:MAG: hypothetical protein RL748_4088 [Pseudomonadota bacterium]